MDSLVAYTNSCINLASASGGYIPDSVDIATRIDTNISSLHTEVKSRLAQSRQILACARNKLAATFYRVPEEILCRVAALVMLDVDGFRIPDLRDGGRVYYRQLYSLLGVCSVWSRVIRSQSELWTPIPMLSHRSRWITRHTAALSLSVAKDRPLHLVARITQSASPDFMNILNDPRHRFCSISLMADSLPFMHQALEALLRANNPHPLRVLAICHPANSVSTYHSPESDNFLTSSGTSSPGRPYDIRRYLQPLQVLGLKGVYLHWQDAMPVNLVELRLQSVSLGSQGSLDHFITGLTRASKLRKIELISVSVIDGVPMTMTMPRQPAALLPSLETLHIEDIGCNHIRPIFSIIAPGSHNTSLFLTEKSAQMHSGMILGTIIPPNENILMSALQQIRVPIHTLILSGDLGGSLSPRNWLPNQCLDRVLQAFPCVTTLKIHEWTFLQEWRGIIHPQPTLPRHSAFPRLQALHLSQANILDVEGLKDVVSSHSLQKLVIGATVALLEKESTPLQEHEDIVDWLASNVPDLEIIDPGYEPTEFQNNRSKKW